MAKSKSKAKATKKGSKKKSSNFFRNIIRWAWFAAILGLLAFVALWLLVSASKLPDTDELENPKYDIASTIIASDGVELGRYFKQNRKWVTYDELNPYLIDALVSTEDERFFEHSGVDPKGTVRAIVFMGSKGGASTITQQLAKLFFTDRSSNIAKRIWQKLKEWVIALRFEKRYTKQEIMAMYLNKVDFLYNAHGVSAAAETYFGKSQEDLEIEEAATIIGMLKNPSYFNPKRDAEVALNRRNVVLGQLMRNEFITREDFDQLKVLPLDGSKFNRRGNYSGLAPYFRTELTKWLEDLFNDDRYLKEDGSKYNIYRDGLKIYTTIDTRMQRHAEQAAQKHMAIQQDKFFAKWKGQDPWTYEADDRQKNQRRGSLNRAIRESDRYSRIRKRNLTKISQVISKDIENVRLLDGDIRRMINESKKAGHFADLLRRKDISKAQASVYKEIMASSHWKMLRNRWSLFQTAVKKEFNKKQKVKVFAYNDKGYEYKSMTPLDSIKYHQMHLQIGSLAIEPNSGKVKTWVGGINYDYFKFDHVQNDRQVGSTFKPFVYITAIFEQKFSPCRAVKDVQYTIPAKDPYFKLLDSWTPKNYDDKYLNTEVTLKDALKASKNTISTWLMIQLKNPRSVREMAERMGISKSKIPNQPSIALGAADLSVMDMTSAYSTFANDGVHIRPIFVDKITDRNGKVIYSDVPESERALPSDYNYVMVDMLKHVVTNQQHLLETTFGGKTGTTNDHVDGWFMGITPELAVGTWVGGDQTFIKFRTIGDGAGSKMARPFYLDFMKRIESDKRIRFNTLAEFNRPADLGIELDCNVYAQFREEARKEQEEMDKQLDDGFDEELEDEIDLELDEEFDEEFEEG